MKKVLRPILTKGEEYNEVPEKLKGPPITDKRPVYSVAKNRLLQEIKCIKNKINTIPETYIMNDVVLSLRMRIDGSSKSSHPRNFIKESNIRQVGTKKWSTEVINKKEVTETKIGKSIFILINKNELDNLSNTIQSDCLGELAKDNIRSIEKLYIDEHLTILNSFDEKWEKGRIEVILHPFFNEEDKMIAQFKKIVIDNGGNVDSIRLKKYDDGPIFISMVADTDTIKKISPFNPLRAVHPLILRNIDTETISQGEGIVQPVSDNEFVSDAILGIFDGGVTTNHKHLNRYVTEYNLTSVPKADEFVNHGNAVVGVALFGDLKNITIDKLPVPSIKVDSFRVFPLYDPDGYVDLYEVVDHIEDVVSNRPDIKVFNISFGPCGAIDDDIISRFTYSIDNLSKDGKRIFVVAVGNDGDLDHCLGRIQSPADSVNNISVGSYCIDNKTIIRAPYSCYGDGREGSKIKPDIVEYGGDDENRMHFISSVENQKLYSYGTSFSAPIVARKLTEILGYSSIKSPLTAKTILIQTSEHPSGIPDKFLGNGIVKNDYLDILECQKNKVTVIYESKLLKAKRAILNIPFIKDLSFHGKVKISWTICIATNIDPLDSDDYTNMCLEDTFYPNIHKFKLSHPIMETTKTFHDINDLVEMNEYIQLGWKKPSMPISRSNAKGKYRTEQERRADFKWDTVVKRTSGVIMYSGVDDPFIILHALSRDKENVKEDWVRYSAVVTIEYIGCTEDAYQKTILEYSKLGQANITNINELIYNN
ncbi:MAG TPA: S8 family peptidase [Clostridium sp.]|uniref:S8 family peptidase n=1 Tax=Clostridium sp. TaxID=1506 RepID=UPI002F925E4B